MIFFSESQNLEFVKQSQQFTNKLKNMKLHLSELLNKQIRLELEIKNLKKTIANKQKEYERTLKVKLSLESNQTIDTNPELLAVFKEDPQLLTSVREFDIISGEIQQILESVNSENYL